MAKITKEDIDKLFKTKFSEIKGDRQFGWEPEDTEKLALALIKNQTKADGTAVKLSAESEKRIRASLQISPKRIVALITDELDSAQAVVDDHTRGYLLRILDVPKFRAELVKGSILEAAPKGRSKASLKDILND